MKHLQWENLLLVVDTPFRDKKVNSSNCYSK